MPIAVLINGETRRFDADTISVGRATENAISLPHDERLAPLQAILKCVAGRWIVEAQGGGSVRVGNGRAAQFAWINPGDVIHLTESGPELVFEPGSAVASRRPRAVSATTRRRSPTVHRPTIAGTPSAVECTRASHQRSAGRLRRVRHRYRQPTRWPHLVVSLRRRVPIRPSRIAGWHGPAGRCPAQQIDDVHRRRRNCRVPAGRSGGPGGGRGGPLRQGSGQDRPKEIAANDSTESHSQNGARRPADRNPPKRSYSPAIRGARCFDWNCRRPMAHGRCNWERRGPSARDASSPPATRPAASP